MPKDGGESMSFVVARMTKMKADKLIGAGNHNQRKTKNHSNEDIDVSRSYLNYDLVNGRTENFKTDIQNYINQNKFGDRAVRKDAVLINELKLFLRKKTLILILHIPYLMVLLEKKLNELFRGERKYMLTILQFPI